MFYLLFCFGNLSLCFFHLVVDCITFDNDFSLNINRWQWQFKRRILLRIDVRLRSSTSMSQNPFAVFLGETELENIFRHYFFRKSEADKIAGK